MKRGVDDPQVRKGDEMFLKAGCVACHTPSHTSSNHEIEALSDKTSRTYIDLLSHRLADSLKLFFGTVVRVRNRAIHFGICQRRSRKLQIVFLTVFMTKDSLWIEAATILVLVIFGAVDSLCCLHADTSLQHARES